MVRHEEAAIPVDLEAVGLAVILADDRELAGRAHPQDASIGDVDAVEIAGPIEGGTFKKGLQAASTMLGL
jgi:hypothetical protein